MKRAIFFDLDGTLWDGLIPLAESWSLAMKENNYPYSFTKDSMKQFMGLTPLETVPLAFNGCDTNKGLELFKLCFDREISYMKTHPGLLYPDEEIVLKELSKLYDLYIVSNSDKGYVENYLNYYNFNKYFKDHVCAGDTNLAKYENIQYLMKKHAISRVIYVGDTMKDKIEANKAGVDFIHAAYGFGSIEDDQHYINSLIELPHEINKIFK
jgi:phosphoglycolate phosphatase